MDADELQARRPRAQRAEDDCRDQRAGRAPSADQRDGDAVEAVAGAEHARVLVLGAEDEQRPGAPAEPAGERHALADAPSYRDAAREGRFATCAGRAPLEAAPGPGEQEPDGWRKPERERKAPDR